MIYFAESEKIFNDIPYTVKSVSMASISYKFKKEVYQLISRAYDRIEVYI